MSSVIVDKQLSFSFSSNPATGALNVRNDGSSFSVALDTAIRIPKDAVDCTLDVIQASLWYTMPNIAQSFGNNTLYFTYNGNAYVFAIPDGLYSLSDLNSAISRHLSNIGLPSNLFIISGDSSTQKTIITYTIAGVRIDFNSPNNIRTVLGFNARLSPVNANAVAGQSEYSDTQAKFNRINSFLVRSSLVNHGLPINNTGAGIIASIPITSSPGAQINYQPNISITINAANIPESPIQFINFDLLDQDLRSVNTLGEYWSITVQIKYKIILRT